MKTESHDFIEVFTKLEKLIGNIDSKLDENASNYLWKLLVKAIETIEKLQSSETTNSQPTREGKGSGGIPRHTSQEPLASQVLEGADSLGSQVSPSKEVEISEEEEEPFVCECDFGAYDRKKDKVFCRCHWKPIIRWRGKKPSYVPTVTCEKCYATDIKRIREWMKTRPQRDSGESYLEKKRADLDAEPEREFRIPCKKLYNLVSDAHTFVPIRLCMACMPSMKEECIEWRREHNYQARLVPKK